MLGHRKTAALHMEYVTWAGRYVKPKKVRWSGNSMLLACDMNLHSQLTAKASVHFLQRSQFGC